MHLNLIKTLLPMLFLSQLSMAEGVVNFYNWADYIGESTIRDFEKEYNIKVFLYAWTHTRKHITYKYVFNIFLIHFNLLYASLKQNISCSLM